MTLAPDLLKLLSRRYEPQSMINKKFKGFDLVFKTDEEGNPILLFLGKLDEKGQVNGSRYARTLKKDNEGKVYKDHWELKGKAT